MLLRVRWYFWLLLITVGGIYCLGVNGPLLFDDGINLEPLRRIDSDLVPWYVVVFTNPSSSVGRPVSMLSFFLNYWLFGFNVTAFKATNILLHLGIGAVVHTFVRHLLKGTVYRGNRDRIALVVVSCWLLSPLYVSTVLYVVQRMAMLSTLFTLLALSAYLSLRESLQEGHIRWRSLSLFCIYALLGVFSKENAVLLPLFVLVLELFFCTPIHNLAGRRLWITAIAVLVGLPMAAVSIVVFHKSAIFFDHGSRPFTIPERLLTEARVLWSYVGSLLVPRSSSFGIFHDDIEISRSWLAPTTTLISILGWLVVVGVLGYARNVDSWRPMAGATAFFLVGHLLESTVFPLEIYFEHRNYLPGVGVFLLLALAGEQAIKNKVLSIGAAKIVIGAYLLVFFAALSQRVLIWSRYETIIYSSYQSHPLSIRSTIEAVAQDAQYGRFDDALAKLQRMREAGSAPLMALNLQTVWLYCLHNKEGLMGKMHELIDNTPMDGSPYTTLSMQHVNELIAERPCSNVPYEEMAALMADRFVRYYDEGEYQGKEAMLTPSVNSLRTRVLEALNLTGQAQKTINLVTAIDRAGRGGIETDVLGAVALINVGKLDEAKLLIEKIKSNGSMAAKMEMESVRALEAMYQARLDEVRGHSND